MDTESDSGHRPPHKSSIGSLMIEEGAAPTRNSWLASFAAMSASLDALAMGMALAYTSPALDSLKEDLDMDKEQGAFFSAVICLGAMFGAFIGGFLGQRIGRRKTLLVVCAPYIVGWTLIATAHDQSVADCGRFITGVAVGISSFAVPTYIVETTAPHTRGAYGAVNQLQVTVGILMAYLLGTFLGWRWLAVASLVPAVLCSLLIAPCPETPQFLFIQQRDVEGNRALAQLRKNSDVSAEISVMKEAATQMLTQPQVGWKTLASPRYRRSVEIPLMLMVFQQFSGVNAAIFFVKQIFTYAGSDDAQQSSIIFGTVQVVATLASCLLMDRAGRRMLLLVSSGGMFFSAFGLGLFFLLKSQGNLQDWLALVSLLAFITFFSLGMGPVPWLITPEVLPNSIRSLVGGIATAVNWIGAFTVSLTFDSLRNSALREYGCFWLYSGVAAACCLYVAARVPETKGKSLEEIERDLTRALPTVRSPLLQATDHTD